MEFHLKFGKFFPGSSANFLETPVTFLKSFLLPVTSARSTKNSPEIWEGSQNAGHIPELWEIAWKFRKGLWNLDYCTIIWSYNSPNPQFLEISGKLSKVGWNFRKILELSESLRNFMMFLGANQKFGKLSGSSGSSQEMLQRYWESYFRFGSLK